MKLAKMERFTCMNAQELAWNDLHLIMTVCRTGSLSGAARVLGVNHSTVFRRVVSIESKLDVRLFDRLATGYVMTEAGEAVLHTAEKLETEVNKLSRHLIGRDLQLYGDLKITLPDAFGLNLLMPYLYKFKDKYPKIKMDLSFSNAALDLSQRQADIAIRITQKPPEMLIGTKVCGMKMTFYAADGYLKSLSRNDFVDYDWLMPNIELDNLKTTSWLNERCSKANVVLTSNSLLTLHKLVQNGLGVAPLPCFLGDQDPLLQRIVDPPKELDLGVWILSHPDLRQTARVNAFRRFFVESMQTSIDLLEGNLISQP